MSASDTSNAEGVRLQKVLAAAGLGSRRACEELIDAGRVTVNDKPVRVQGMRVDPERDAIRVDGMRVATDITKVYLALNKPKGMLSAMSDDSGRRTIGDIIDDPRLYHVGRLDADTEGLLLVTNDGELANRLMHPRYAVPKTYLVEVEGPVARGIGRQLREGVTLEDGPASVDSFRLVDAIGKRAMIEVVVHEGRNRLVRRLFDAVDYPVLRLVRVAVGPILLGDLKPGATRKLRRGELGELFRAVDL